MNSTGTHFLCDLSCDMPMLDTHEMLRGEIEQWLLELQLNVLGVIAHDFTPSGFTLVFCLSESHLSVHTFPEKGIAAIDVYLSNYKQDNTQKGKELIKRMIAHFQAVEYSLKEVTR